MTFHMLQAAYFETKIMLTEDLLLVVVRKKANFYVSVG